MGVAREDEEAGRWTGNGNGLNEWTKMTNGARKVNATLGCQTSFDLTIEYCINIESNPNDDETGGKQTGCPR